MKSTFVMWHQHEQLILITVVFKSTFHYSKTFLITLVNINNLCYPKQHPPVWLILLHPGSRSWQLCLALHPKHLASPWTSFPRITVATYVQSIHMHMVTRSVREALVIPWLCSSQSDFAWGQPSQTVASQFQSHCWLWGWNSWIWLPLPCRSLFTWNLIPASTLGKIADPWAWNSTFPELFFLQIDLEDFAFS